MPKFRVKIRRLCVMAEDGEIEIEAADNINACEKAEDFVRENSDSIAFGKEYLESMEYIAMDAILRKSA
jgi:hypothetical protein